MLLQICFKGATYSEDCGIYIELLEEYPNAKLWPSGVMIEIEESSIEPIRKKLQEKLKHQVRCFKRED